MKCAFRGAFDDEPSQALAKPTDLKANNKFMPPKRRFWKELQKMICIFKALFKGVSTRFGLRTI